MLYGEPGRSGIGTAGQGADWAYQGTGVDYEPGEPGRALISSKWRNPFPKTRYTERPDTAAAALLEGRIIILVDNSPSAMILPSGIFDFFREADRLLFSSHYRNVFADYPYRHFSINPVFNPVVAFVGGTSSVDPSVAVLYRCVKTQWRAAFSTAAGAGIRCGWTSYGVYNTPSIIEQLLEYYRSAFAGRFCGPVRVVCAGNHSVSSLSPQSANYAQCQAWNWDSPLNSSDWGF